ncbi:MAG TPA: excinuclease ABC subunit A, partial [Thauera sp.]|nr:excinuclease ABC subunit A [Thauera sp.]
LFSFNSPIGACETCRGFGRVIGVDFGLVVPDESKTLAEGAVKPWQTESYRECQADLEKMAKKYGVAMDIPVRDLPPEHRQWLFEGDPKWKNWDSSWPRYWYGVRHFFDWLETKAYKMHIRVLLSRYRSYTECPACHGARLKPDALLWRLPTSAPTGGAATGLAIHELMAMPVDRIREAVAALRIPGVPDEATELVLGEIRSRLNYLTDVGLGYLTLDRQSRTLSGGEVQRINLTTALGTSLVNTLFVLDEPSIGLHPRDIGRILGVMTRLRDAGNTLVVVEHDPQVMVAADELLEIGPGPGERGGNIVARGTPAEIAANPDSVTGPWLAGKKRIDVDRPPRRVDDATPRLTLVGARQHNLRDLRVGFPLQRLTCLTGVSGSGKSTLINDTLYRIAAHELNGSKERAAAHGAVANLDLFDKVVEIDQSPIGRTPRSNPATYTKAFDLVRELYAEMPQAKTYGYGPGRFSFNVTAKQGGGRCEACEGAGVREVEMHFLANVFVTCEVCRGKRYNDATLRVTYKDKSIADLLDTPVDEALELFKHHRQLGRIMQTMVDVGLGYLSLGQPATTLSGGEAQRVKLALELSKRDTGRTLYILDEPTTGLHFADIELLLKVLHQLRDAGNTIVVIEHNLD